MDCIHFSCGERRQVGWGSDCKCGAGPARARVEGEGAKGPWIRNRCGSALEDEGRRAGPRTMPAEEEVRSKAGRVGERRVPVA